MGSMEQDTRDAIESRFTDSWPGGSGNQQRRLDALLDQFRDAVLSGPDVTEHEAWRPVGDALEKQVGSLAVDPEDWDQDASFVSVMVNWLEQSAEWLEESITHRIAEDMRERAASLEKTLGRQLETASTVRQEASKVDPWTRGADPEGWPCWVRKSDGKPVPPAWVKD